MANYYSSERSVQILISLLKQHKIKKVIASPGTTNITFIGSIMNDPWFEIYSCVDERSAAYMACGLAEESGEPVVLSCTGATASRNYFSALTEAFYDKIPILAVTATQGREKVGNLVPQVIDRSIVSKDITVLSEYIPLTVTKEDEWSNNLKINRALLKLRENGGGPVHLDFKTSYSNDFSIKELPLERTIFMTSQLDMEGSFNFFPSIEKFNKIAIFIGRHKLFTDQETSEIDEFCERNNAIVICDHTSGFNGKYKILFSLINNQQNIDTEIRTFDLLIHLGEMSGSYFTLYPHNVWRVNTDGKVSDTFRKLTHVFKMNSYYFFNYYNRNNKGNCRNISLFERYKKLDADIRNDINYDLIPFSTIWVASKIADFLPENSIAHLGIANSLRSLNFFNLKNKVKTTCNTGGFGIDGITSTLIGASLAFPEKLYFAILGDLAFFYDLNSIGNREVKNNLRILIMNNGTGMEMKIYRHLANIFGDQTDKFISASNHFGSKSKNLIKHFSQDLGYDYYCAETKEEFNLNIESFCSKLTLRSKPIIFEVFIEPKNDNVALKYIENLYSDYKSIAKQKIKSVIGEGGIKIINSIRKK